MKTIIKGKIDVTKVTKDRLFQGKNGAKYLSITLLEVENDKYDNDFMIVEEVSKEERLKGIKGPILGNAKYFTQRAQVKPSETKPEVQDEEPSDVPF